MIRNYPPSWARDIEPESAINQLIFPLGMSVNMWHEELNSPYSVSDRIAKFNRT
jgi:hypothetical protein